MPVITRFVLIFDFQIYDFVSCTRECSVVRISEETERLIRG